jgi:hypothetical protein
MRRVLLACAAIALLGCGGDDSTGPPADVEGMWNLQTVNGVALPFTYDVEPPSYTAEVVSDMVQVNADGTYTETSHIRETDAGTVTEHDQTGGGTWTVRGNSIDLTDETGLTVTGRVNGNTMSIDAGLDLVYSRQ